MRLQFILNPQCACDASKVRRNHGRSRPGRRRWRRRRRSGKGRRDGRRLIERIDGLIQRLHGRHYLLVVAFIHRTIVIVLEGPDSGALGARLAEISGWDGVLSANMVYEHIDEPARPGEQQ